VPVLAVVVVVCMAASRVPNRLRAERQDEVPMRCRVRVTVDAVTVPVHYLAHAAEGSEGPLGRLGRRRLFRIRKTADSARNLARRHHSATAALWWAASQVYPGSD
jgi:hypothetical protein